MQHLVSINEIIDAREHIAPLFPLDIMATPPVRFNFSRHNPAISHIDAERPEDLDRFVLEALRRSTFLWGYGGWGEERSMYLASPQFRDGREHRSVHLGIDIWLPAGTPLYAPMTGTIYDFKENREHLDLGPTIVTKHTIGSATFYILYGHLDASSLEGLRRSTVVRSGDPIGKIASSGERTAWPPHVHLQLIADIGERAASFPIVVKPSEREKYLLQCPNPESLIAPFLVA